MTLIKPSRKNPLRKYKDYLLDCFEEEIIKNQIKSFFEITHKYDIYSELYQQEYKLGEDLFNAHISKEIAETRLENCLQLL